MAPLALGTMMAVSAVAAGVQRPFPGALAGSLLAAAILTAVSWWWFRAIRRARAD
jgi:hypothetical protein